MSGCIKLQDQNKSWLQVKTLIKQLSFVIPGVHPFIKLTLCVGLYFPMFMCHEHLLLQMLSASVLDGIQTE